MRAAGAILLGKTNCPEYGGGIETDNPVHGRTSNPYDPARTPGGSSGGEAAIVAAEGSPCGLGTDSGASVRLPAHFCGLASLKPSAGRVPLTGVLDDEGQLGTLGDPRTQVGPLARSVEDVALLLRVVGGSRRARRRGRAGRARRARGRRAARPARRRADRERPRRAHSRDGRRRRGGRGRAAGGGRERRGRAPSRRRARADDRGLALVRRGRPGRRAVAAPAPLGRVPRPHARVRRRATTCCSARCSTDPRGRTGR